MKENTLRFSNRVDDYIKFRPRYPKKIIDLLQDKIHLNSHKIVADIGSGTGISSELFLNNKNKVYGVEPNKEMREAQETLLKEFKDFKSINGSSEKTTLKENSIDLIFCGQAFHWFDKTKSKQEFERILKPNGNIVLVWNSRSMTDKFQITYENILIETIGSYKNTNHRHISDEEIANFFYPYNFNKYTLDNKQTFDLKQLIGRLKSSSYCPKEGKEYEDLINKVTSLFHKYEQNGKIDFIYNTQIYWC